LGPWRCSAARLSTSAFRVRDEQELADRVKSLVDTDGMDDHAKALALGLLLFDVLGENVVTAAVSGLRESIRG